MTLSAIITPPDIFSQVLVAMPLMVLYEIGIVISRRILRQQEAEFNDPDPSEKKKAAPKKKAPKKKADKKEDNVGASDEKVKGDIEEMETGDSSDSEVTTNKKGDPESDTEDDKESDVGENPPKDDLS